MQASLQPQYYFNYLRDVEAKIDRLTSSTISKYIIINMKWDGNDTHQNHPLNTLIATIPII